MNILNDDQKEAADKIVDFIENDTDLEYFTLTGAPGTGKSFMLNEVLKRTSKFYLTRSAATVAHAAKNVLQDMFTEDIKCFTVAQWLGLRLKYADNGDIMFSPNKKAFKTLIDSDLAILDEASMINDELYDSIMNIVRRNNIKLIVVGDVAQLPPVSQDHDSKFFNSIQAELTIPMRFKGPISEIADLYRKEINNINLGYSGDSYILNTVTNRQDKVSTSLNTGYYFKNDIHSLIAQVADEIKQNPDDLNFSRMLAYKNSTIAILNKEVRKYIYGVKSEQFEDKEILLSKGGYSFNNVSIIHNGKLLRVAGILPITGAYNIPCYSLKFKDFIPHNNIVIPVVRDSKYATDRYNSIKTELANNAKRDPRQWPAYYDFINSFAYFDYAYSTSIYKAQGQTLTNAYVMEGEIMGVKPLSLKQKFQALYVAMTRPKNNLYIYNKSY